MSGVSVIVIGAGGHAAVLLDALMMNNIDVLGVTEADRTRMGQKVLGFPILGDDETVRRHAPESVFLVNALGSVASMALRKSVYQRFSKEGYSFASIVHPAAVIARSASLAQGVQIMAGAVVQARACIGENTIVNTGTTVDHDCHVGAHVHLAPGVTLSGGVTIGEESHIGAGATIIQGVRIGARSTVGAGSVVLQDVPEGSRVAGVPARELKE